MANVLCALCLLLLFSCKNVNRLVVPASCDSLARGDKGFVQLAKKNELGEKLVIYGKVLDSATMSPVKNASLFFYQANTAGRYKSLFFGYPPLARIRGRLRTNDSGCFIIQTILPGDYPGARDNRHIHFVLKASGYKTIRKEFLFDGFLNQEMRQHAVQHHSGIILQINKNNEGVWIGVAELVIGK